MDHYNKGKIEPIDVILDWDLDFCLGCVVKYVGRYRHKGTPLDDLRKAADYLQREITAMESEQNKQSEMV